MRLGYTPLSHNAIGRYPKPNGVQVSMSQCVYLHSFRQVDKNASEGLIKVAPGQYNCVHRACHLSTIDTARHNKISCLWNVLLLADHHLFSL